MRVLPALLALLLTLAPRLDGQSRRFAPEDLFRIEQVGRVSWAPDGAFATVEIRPGGRTVDPSIPTNELRLLDAATGALTMLRAPDGGQVGYFGASWSPTGRRVAFFSVDTSGSVRLWTAERGQRTARAFGAVRVRHELGDPARVHWLDDRRVLVVARAPGEPEAGPLYFRVTRGGNAARLTARGRRGDSATAVVMESGGGDTTRVESQLLRLDLVSRTRAVVARGGLHHLHVSPDRRTIAWFGRRAPGAPGRVAALFESTLPGDVLYDAVNHGSVLHVRDLDTGRDRIPPTELVDTDYESLRWLDDGALAVTSGIRGTAPAPRLLSTRGGTLAPLAEAPRAATSRPGPPSSGIAPPAAGARRIAVAPAGTAALFVEQDPAAGTRLWLARAQAPPRVVWRGNAWVGDVLTGHSERIRYRAQDGRALDGWLLYPPGHARGTPLPVIAQVYPGRTYGGTVPAAFGILSPDFEHPQLFAALGYGVLLPSVPEPERPTPDDQRAALRDAVLPLLDTLVARGIADPARIGVVGQSAGGFGVLSLVTETTRFRTAIASASYANLESLYGTFYGQSRHGDAGHPLDAQLLRMLQMERGHAGLGASPLEAREAYRRNSPLLHAGDVRTPLMLVHGDHDFIPVQQAEELFTALYRQDKRARFVRYHGEFHTIASRANVLDLWARLGDWLRETMP